MARTPKLPSPGIKKDKIWEQNLQTILCGKSSVSFPEIAKILSPKYSSCIMHFKDKSVDSFIDNTKREKPHRRGESPQRSRTCLLCASLFGSKVRLHGEMVVQRYSTTQIFSLFHLTKPQALASNPEMSTSLVRLICSSSLFLVSLPIIFSLDGTPIRVFKNLESFGVPFPKKQPKRIYSSLWNSDDWAARGGLIKTDWSKTPLAASYRNFNAKNACVWSNGWSSCSSTSPSFSASFNAWLSQELDLTSQQ